MVIFYLMSKFFIQAIEPDYCKRASLLTALILLCSLSTAWGETADRSPNNIPVEKVLISADHMQLDLESGYSVYTGNVKISQGELVLTGDKVTLQQHDNEIERITVIGKPARYNHVTEKGDSIKAQSEHMVYIASQNKLILTINAKLQQPDNLVSSQKITYDTLNRIVIAGDNGDSSPGKNSPGEKPRVNITLTPKKKLQPDNFSPAEKAPGNK